MSFDLFLDKKPFFNLKKRHVFFPNHRIYIGYILTYLYLYLSIECYILKIKHCRLVYYNTKPRL